MGVNRADFTRYDMITRRSIINTMQDSIKSSLRTIEHQLVFDCNTFAGGIDPGYVFRRVQPGAKGF